MTSYQLLESHGPDLARRRFYIDGERVNFGEYWRFVNMTARHDCFQTLRRGNRWLHYSRVTY